MCPLSFALVSGLRAVPAATHIGCEHLLNLTVQLFLDAEVGGGRFVIGHEARLRRGFSLSSIRRVCYNARLRAGASGHWRRHAGRFEMRAPNVKMPLQASVARGAPRLRLLPVVLGCGRLCRGLRVLLVVCVLGFVQRIEVGRDVAALLPLVMGLSCEQSPVVDVSQQLGSGRCGWAWSDRGSGSSRG